MTGLKLPVSLFLIHCVVLPFTCVILCERQLAPVKQFLLEDTLICPSQAMADDKHDAQGFPFLKDSFPYLPGPCGSIFWHLPGERSIIPEYLPEFQLEGFLPLLCCPATLSRPLQRCRGLYLLSLLFHLTCGRQELCLINLWF